MALPVLALRKIRERGPSTPVVSMAIGVKNRPSKCEYLTFFSPEPAQVSTHEVTKRFPTLSWDRCDITRTLSSGQSSSLM